MISRNSKIAMYALAVFTAVVSMSPAIRGQALSVLPVNVHMGPGEQAATVTINNQGSAQTSVQIRAYKWNQDGDKDELTASNEVVVSPPIVTIGAGQSQVVRLILRQAPQDREATYRIVLDQIPPPAEPGVVHVVLRTSIPIFAQPKSRANSDLQFHVETKDGNTYLVGVNDGLRHESIRGIELKTSDGRELRAANGESPYILAGSTRHWKIDSPDAVSVSNNTFQLTAHSDAGAIEEQVQGVIAR